MKTLGLLAAAAAAAAAMLAIPAASAAPVSAAPAPIAVSAPASAAQVRVVVRENRRGVRARHYRGHRRAYNRRVCTNRWRHGHRVRVCRNVRAWR